MWALILLMTIITYSTCEFDPEIHEKYLTLPREEFVKYFNNVSSWKIGLVSKDYPLLPKDIFDNMEKLDEMPRLEGVDLPENFDAREKWGNCGSLNEIYDQGNCGSCWTFGTATVASDRTCIHKNIDVRLSQQDLQCCTNCFPAGVCDGGNPSYALNFWRDSGLVSQSCKPYDIDELLTRSCQNRCVNGQDYQSDKHYALSVYSVPRNEDDIKAELVTNGPIQASFMVYTDFVNYTGAVYTHKYGVFEGGHSVRIIGYGTENGEDYWLGANSWGTDWGEGGYFKFKRYQPLMNFEEYLVAGLPKN